MKSAVWGSGAIGGVVGAGIAAGGEDVLLVDVVPEHVNAMNNDGLVIKSAAGEQRVRVRAVQPEEGTGYVRSRLPGGQVAVHECRARRDPASPGSDSAVVSLQNGVNEPHIAKRIGANRTHRLPRRFSADYPRSRSDPAGAPGNLFHRRADGSTTRRSRKSSACSRFLRAPTFAPTSWATCGRRCARARSTRRRPWSMRLRRRTPQPGDAPGAHRARARGDPCRGGRRRAVEAFDHSIQRPFLDVTPAGMAAAGAVLDDWPQGAPRTISGAHGYWRDIVVRKRKRDRSHHRRESSAAASGWGCRRR